MAVDPKKYSLYAQRSAEEQYVNWGKVASDVTKGIYTIGAERQRRKDELDNLTQQSVENLSKIPDVTNRDANGLIIEASDMSKKNLQIQHDLLKRGLITPKDYKLFMSQQQSGYGNMSAAIKQWDGWYQEAMTRELEGNDGKGVNVFESYGNTTVESFGNLKNKMLWTNPANGQVQLVEMGDNGEGQYIIMPDGSENPEKFISPYALNARMNMKDRAPKDLTEEVKKIVDPLAQDITQYIDEKGISTFKEGFRFRGDSAEEEATYEEWLDSQVEALTATNLDMGEVLVNQQRGYQIAQSKDDFKRRYCKNDKVIESPGAQTNCDESYIKKYMIKVSYEGAGRQIELSKDQQKLAATITRNAIDNQIDNIVKQDKEMSPSSKGDEDALKLGEDRIKTIGEIYSNKDPEMVKRAIKSLLTTSDDRFAEFDQKTVKLTDGREIVTEIIVPYIDSDSGNKISKPIVFHELKEGATKGSKDPKDYVAVSPDQFSKGMYEMISMADAKYVPYSEVQKYVDNDLIINATGNKSYKPIIESLIDPREGITIESPIGSGKTQTKVKEIYSKAITAILGSDFNVYDKEVAELANKMNEAIRQAAVHQGDDAAANRVKITNIEDKSIEIQIEGEETKTTITIPGALELDSSNLQSQIDNVMNEVLQKILPAIKGGYESDTNADPLNLNINE